MVNDAELCNITHYNCKNYIKNVPLPTLGNKNCMTSMNPHGVEQQQCSLHQQREDAMLQTIHHLKQRIAQTPYNNASQKYKTLDSEDSTELGNQGMFCTTYLSNKATPEAPSLSSPLKRAQTEGEGVPAIDQALIDEFFLDGSTHFSGKTLSGYPIYGTRSAEERLLAVREALASIDDYGTVEMHPPLALHHHHRGDGSDCVESREQYLRRLVRHYISVHPNQGMAGWEARSGRGTDALPTTLDPKEQEAADPFYIIDLGCVIEQMARWRHHLPMVRPFFAVKCNPNLPMMRLLSAMGAGFDCASKVELAMVMSNNLVDTPDSIIFANPCKQLGDLRVATMLGVTYVVCDNAVELEKISKHMPQAQVLIRIRTNDQAAQCAFSVKFGASLQDVPMLLSTARSLNVDIYGVSFHVGSGNSDTNAYVGAIRDAHHVFELAAQYGFNCTMLDIGGGFPGTLPTPEQRQEGCLAFEDIAEAIAPVLSELFPNTTIISEPGRYFTAASHTLAMNVFATRKVHLPEEVHSQYARALKHAVTLDEPEEYQYYVNDGIYDSFNCILFDHAHPKLVLLDDGDGVEIGSDDENDFGSNGRAQQLTAVRDPFVRQKSCPRRPLRLTTIFGPTCDSLDCILKRQPFPEMSLGDWLLAFDMGSYTTAAGCAFNGFKTHRKEYISSAVV